MCLVDKCRRHMQQRNAPLHHINQTCQQRLLHQRYIGTRHVKLHSTEFMLIIYFIIPLTYIATQNVNVPLQFVYNFIANKNVTILKRIHHLILVRQINKRMLVVLNSVLLRDLWVFLSLKLIEQDINHLFQNKFQISFDFDLKCVIEK